MELLTIGPPHVMAQDTIYALPARQVLAAITGSAGPVIECSNDPAFGTLKAITLTNGQALLAFQFIRATTIADGIISLKAA